ncbi:hypothetical protein NCAS_0I02970 [Naumovozyma castellii]|uniref:ATP synthase mitochondrial F1 complex assembly factor 2 n=1 Tax=Naumovozyma castellii TaxID=27288 RepID=G0VKD1_NAUCA|nr:hypothetical protein NCAS_0I02970 [Naumovozyma castellii CBS 4309]CCC71965.1 hypothetical protein NCAS_0I02970 [Naumovozyma castellii CBS 4309]
MLKITTFTLRQSLRSSRCSNLNSIRRLTEGSLSTAVPLGADKTLENNLKTETNRLLKTGKKFWEDVKLNDKLLTDKISIEIDTKPIRTPLGNLLAVSKDKPLLAYLIRQEWATLTELSLNTDSMPLTSLVSRCIDLASTEEPGCDPNLIAKIGADRNQINSDLLRYLDTDTLLVFSPRAELEGVLRADQDKLYLPIIQGIKQFLSDYRSHASPIKLRTLDADIHGLRGNMQSQETKDAAINYLNSLSLWDLAVFEKTVLVTKSFVCGILLLQNKASKTVPLKQLQVDAERIAHLATLEITHQTRRWGEVEDTHDVNKVDIRRNIGVAAIAAFSM